MNLTGLIAASIRHGAHACQLETLFFQGFFKVGNAQAAKRSPGRGGIAAAHKTGLAMTACRWFVSRQATMERPYLFFL